MNEIGLRFRSKVDGWLVGLLVAAILVGPVLTVLLGKPGLNAILVAITLALVGGTLIVWMLNSTAYFVTTTELVIRCGPMRTVVPLESIRRIVPSRSLASVPALSLDRLALQCIARSAVDVSPVDKAGFIRAISDRVPGVVVDAGLIPLGAA